MRGSVERKLYELYGSDCDDLLDTFQSPSLVDQEEVNQSVDGSMSNEFTSQMQSDPTMREAFDKMIENKLS